MILQNKRKGQKNWPSVSREDEGEKGENARLSLSYRFLAGRRRPNDWVVSRPYSATFLTGDFCSSPLPSISDKPFHARARKKDDACVQLHFEKPKNGDGVQLYGGGAGGIGATISNSWPTRRQIIVPVVRVDFARKGLPREASL